ncbi:hypothetical protein [Pararhizobium gei]|uniref:hypothetical protein n=1 Tax=Pararhizobium gei TaxID=1395951 RepID=UPI0023D9AAB3|nr:hypothetical protein [Rhizobium gei]
MKHPYGDGASWVELTTRDDEKIYVNFAQVIGIYPVDDSKHTRLSTPGGDIYIKEHLAFIQSKIAI